MTLEGNRITSGLSVAGEDGKATLGEPVTKPPLVSGKLAAVAGAFVPILMGAAAFLPPPFGTLAFILAFVASALCGLALPQPAFVASKPLVGAAAVPALATVSSAAVAVSEVLPDSNWKWAAYAVALLLSWMAGLAAPQPRKA